MTGIFVGAVTGDPSRRIELDLKRANRHGLIAGATGTGKTVTLQVLAESFSQQGVPVFITDVKGDLSGICETSRLEGFLVQRAEAIGLSPFNPSAAPTIFWDMFGQSGHPVRTTISEVGPLLLARLLELNDTQQGVLDIVFRVADEQGLLLLDLKDLRAFLTYVAENADVISKDYGQVAGASVATIQRALLRLEQQQADRFFSEPVLKLSDLMRVSYDGRGFVSLFAANKLMETPRLYATFLLWLLSELFEDLPEVGDADKPKLVLFFDEAHLLFTDMPKALLEKIEQVVRLIRSKGVGVYFVTQNPTDVPDRVSGQLGHRIQHALRAFTPAQQKNIQAVVDGFRPNPALDVASVVQELAVGEALVSLLGDKGEPSVVERVLIRPPASRLGPADAATIARFIQNSPVGDVYTAATDRESAYEMLTKRTMNDRADARSSSGNDYADEADALFRGTARGEKTSSRSSPAQRPERAEREDDRGANRQASRQGVGEALVKSVVRAVGSSVGRQIAREVMRGVLGGLSRRR